MGFSKIERGMSTNTIHVVDAGRLDYLHAWRLQQRLAEARRTDRVPDLLLLTEHPPTYTIGRRGSRDNLLIDKPTLKNVGAVCYDVDRGGDITFHGPGQLVVYSIIDLGLTQRSVRRYVENLETVVIRTLAQYGLDTSIDPAYPGVWLGRDKIAAIGISIHHGVSYHGFALNVDPDLRYFDYMIPCGIPDRGATSLSREIGRRVEIRAVSDLVVEHFATVFGVSLERDLNLEGLVRSSQNRLTDGADAEIVVSTS